MYYNKLTDQYAIFDWEYRKARVGYVSKEWIIRMLLEAHSYKSIETLKDLWFIYLS
jgi:hypothetical protein